MILEGSINDGNTVFVSVGADGLTMATDTQHVVAAE